MMLLLENLKPGSQLLILLLCYNELGLEVLDHRLHFLDLPVNIDAAAAFVDKFLAESAQLQVEEEVFVLLVKYDP